MLDTRLAENSDHTFLAIIDKLKKYNSTSMTKKKNVIRLLRT